MKAIGAMCLVAALAACQSTATNTSFVGPSGVAIQKAKCSRAPEACYQQASEVCRGPYQVIESESHAGGALADALPGPVTWYGLSYACGPSDGRLASFPFRGQAYIPSPEPLITNCQRFGNMSSCQTF